LNPIAIKTAGTLAIEGGTPLTTRSFAPWPHFQQPELDAANAVLRSGKVNYWTGDEGRQFEREFADFVGVNHAVALANGSVALELALLTLGVGPGDDVVVTPRTFLASASCVVLRGARPIFADVDRNSGNITADAIRDVLTPRTKAIIAVHLGGWPCDMDPIMDLAEERGLKVIEDCAQAHGASYRGKPVGSIGEAATFSFCQDKIMTTAGEGGMLLTNRTDLWEQAWSFKDHGKSYDAVYRRQHPPGFRWVHESFGTNWRLTEVQSAMGRILLRRLPQDVAIRHAHARRLNASLANVPGIRLTIPPDDIVHSYYKYYIFLEPERLRPGWTRDRILEAINAEGVPCFSGSCSEIYLEKAFPPEMRPPERLPGARELGETSLMFMVHPTLSEQEIELTAGAILKVMAVAAD